MTRRKPLDLRVLEGNPGKRRIAPRGVAPTGEATAPAHLEGYALDVWDRVIASMPPSTYRPTDAELLAAWCSACADHREATVRLTIERTVLIGARGRRTVNPWRAVQRDAAKQIEALGKRLGLDPIARADLPSPPPPASPSRFAGLIATPEPGEPNDDD